MSDIKEDIKLLENAIKCNKKQFEELGVHILLQDDEMKAIENILNRLEQDERVIEEMAEYIHITQHCKVIFGGKKPVPYLKEDIIDHFRKKCE